MPVSPRTCIRSWYFGFFDDPHEFVLSGRFKSTSNGIRMHVTMRFHQMMARTALVFALLHPCLYQGTPSGGQRPWDPTR